MEPCQKCDRYWSRDLEGFLPTDFPFSGPSYHFFYHSGYSLYQLQTLLFNAELLHTPYITLSLCGVFAFADELTARRKRRRWNVHLRLCGDPGCSFQLTGQSEHRGLGKRVFGARSGVPRRPWPGVGNEPATLWREQLVVHGLTSLDGSCTVQRSSGRRRPCSPLGVGSPSWGVVSGSAAVLYVGGKNKLLAGLLAIFLGMFGIHKFYLDFNKTGAIMAAIGISGVVLSFFGLGFSYFWGYRSSR